MNQFNDYTGLPTKDETSETTVRNIYCLLHNIHDSLQLQTCSFLCQIIKYAMADYHFSVRKFPVVFIVQLFLGNPVPFPFIEFLGLKTLWPSYFF